MPTDLFYWKVDEALNRAEDALSELHGLPTAACSSDLDIFVVGEYLVDLINEVLPDDESYAHGRP